VYDDIIASYGNYVNFSANNLWPYYIYSMLSSFGKLMSRVSLPVTFRTQRMATNYQYISQQDQQKQGRTVIQRPYTIKCGPSTTPNNRYPRQKQSISDLRKNLKTLVTKTASDYSRHDFSWIACENTRRFVENMYYAALDLDILEWMREELPLYNQCYMCLDHLNIHMLKEHPLVFHDGHSCSTFVTACRYIMELEKEGWHETVQKYIDLTRIRINK